MYRTIELADGWNGRIISTQVYFSGLDLTYLVNAILIILTDVLDGAMVTLAIYTLNFAHPGFLLRDCYDPEYKLRTPGV